MTKNTVIGYGSLLSEKSAKRTCPDLENFRTVRVQGYARSFNLVDRFAFPSAHYPLPSDKHIGTCAAFSLSDAFMIASAFDVDDAGLQAIKDREYCYDFHEVNFEDLSNGKTGKGIISVGYKDQKDYEGRSPNRIHEQALAPYYQGDIWRDDILPYCSYLRFCLDAAREQGNAIYNSFLTNAFLADKKTTIGEYIKDHPEVLKAPLPPSKPSTGTPNTGDGDQDQSPDPLFHI